MFNLKKLLAFTLIAALLLTVFAACGTKPPAEGTTTLLETLTAEESSTMDESQTQPTIPPPGQYSVMTKGDSLNMRSGPGQENDVTAKIPNGTVVPLYGVVEGWGHVSYKGVSGWVSLDYLQPYTDKGNLIETMPTAEVEALNQFFHPFAFDKERRLAALKTDIDIIRFGVHWANMSTGQGATDLFDRPKAEVEKIVKRYFDVKTINHEAVGDNGFAVPSYKDGFYNSGSAQGWEGYEWYNTTDLRANGDGTYTAKLDLFFYMFNESMPEKMEAFLSERRYLNYSDWKLPPGIEIIDGDEYDAICRLSSNTVVLKKITYEGQQTWQITAINGWDIPKNLLA